MTAAFPTPPELAGHPYFQYRNNVLYAEDVPLDHLAHGLGTPLYVYSRAALKGAWETYRSAIGQRPVLVCYGMKANSNLAVLKEFARLGAGFDIVSGGELKRALAVGADPSKIVFSGVGKQAWEMRAALAAQVKCFNVESEAELHRLSDVAEELGVRAPVSLRVNPDVDAQTHPYISTGLKENKFGIAIESALDVYRVAQSLPGLDIVGVDCHIGSQLTDISPYFDALEKLLDLIDALDQEGIRIAHLDLGGGLGIRYTDETPPSPQALLDRVFERLNARGQGHLLLVLEPGRSLVGNAGVLLTTVQYLKHAEARNFAIVDAAMNDLLRPALYEAFHGVQPLRPRAGDQVEYDIVGPVCESADWLARQRKLAIQQGDVLAVESAGAYSMAMASNYNTRARAAEVMVDGANYHVVRQRETLDDLLRGESTLP
jgi:diaminopimelate decarboxylase